MPWNSFVAAFLYYTLLLAVLLGGAAVRGPVVAGAYGAPLVVWAVAVCVRLARAAVARAAEVVAARRLECAECGAGAG